MTNLIHNSGFESDWGDEKSHCCLVCAIKGAPHEEIRDNIFTPPGWLTWFRHEPGTWDQPEVRDAWKSGDPRRTHSGEKGILLFTFYRKHDAGFLQQVKVKSGDILELTAYAHAWSNFQDGPHPDDPRWSEGPGREAGFVLRAEEPPEGSPGSLDDWRNFAFQVGIDPTGGIDPFAETVVWGAAANIYNEYASVPPITATAQTDMVTVFLRSKTLWTFKHNDAYWDDASLVVVGHEEPFTGEDERGYPRVQYERTYVLVPPDTAAEWMNAIVDTVWDSHRFTVGGSADDAGIGNLNIRRIIAINPREWPGNLREFYLEHYPDVYYYPIEAENLYQLRGRLLAMSLRLDGVRLAYPTTYLPYFETDYFGRWRETYYHNGLDLRSSWAAWGTEVLAAVDGVVVVAGSLASEPWFGYQVRTKTVLPDGREMFLRYAHFTPDGVYVSIGDRVSVGDKLGRPDDTGSSYGDHLHFDVKVGGQYADPALLIVRPDADIEDPIAVGGDFRVGFSDPDCHGAGEWMIANEVKGPLCIPLFIGDHSRDLDFTHYAEAGIDVIVNLRYSWSVDKGGAGTLPAMGEENSFIEACRQTIRDAKGVYSWTIGNESNNPREFSFGCALTPAYVASIYNQVAEGFKGKVLLSPGAVDPFYGPSSSCRDWFEQIWSQISWASFVDVHGYIRGADPTLCWDQTKFSHPPLQWQGLNYLECITTLLTELPTEYRDLPVLVSEFNHLWLDVEPNWGWVNDERAARVVTAAVDRIREWNESGATNPITQLCLYRWAGDEWAVADNSFVLGAVWEEMVKSFATEGVG